MITNSNEKTSLRILIEREANDNPYVYDDIKKMVCGRGRVFAGTQEDCDKLNKHHKICVQLQEISKEFNNYPYTSLVYFAIGGTAHKQSTFNAGYTSINVKKMKKVLKWLFKLAKYCKDNKYATYDVITHALSKFYDKVSQDDKVFNSLLREFKCNGRRPSSFKKMEDFYGEFMSPLYSNLIIEE